VTLYEAASLVDPERLHAILLLDRHHEDDHGRPWWYVEEWIEADALAEYEARERGSR
jgi:hypothetical protein